MKKQLFDMLMEEKYLDKLEQRIDSSIQIALGEATEWLEAMGGDEVDICILLKLKREIDTLEATRDYLRFLRLKDDKPF